jgi:hypothetical protein
VDGEKLRVLPCSHGMCKIRYNSIPLSIKIPQTFLIFTRISLKHQPYV